MHACPVRGTYVDRPAHDVANEVAIEAEYNSGARARLRTKLGLHDNKTNAVNVEKTFYETLSDKLFIYDIWMYFVFVAGRAHIDYTSLHVMCTELAILLMQMQCSNTNSQEG